MTDLKVGDKIPKGTVVLITSGEYSSYGIIGLFKATEITTVPGKTSCHTWDSEEVIDTHKLSVMLEEVECSEAWGDE